MISTKELQKASSPKKPEPFVCSDCGERFQIAYHLTKHRHLKHPPPPRPPSKRVACPDCGRTFDRPTSLGSHRRSVHGIVGSAKSTVLARNKRLSALPPPVPVAVLDVNQAQIPEVQPTRKGIKKGNLNDAKALAAQKRSYKKRETALETTTIPIESNGHHPAAASGIPEATLLVAYGRFIEFQASLARELDLPPRQFAREFHAVIRSTPVW